LVLDSFKNDGSILEHEKFMMTLYNFPLPAKAFNSVIKALSPSYVHLKQTFSLMREENYAQLLLNEFIDKKNVMVNL